MKRIILILSLLLSLSLLFGGQAGKAKASLNLGLANGASLGVGLDSPYGENRDNYLNIHAYYCRLFWCAGICREIRTYNDRNDFYYLVSAGVNIGQMLPYPLDRDLFVSPHVALGVGHRFKLGRNSYMFVEWDVGLKLSVTNINVGVTF